MSDKEIIEEVLRLIDAGVSVTLPVTGRSMLPFIVGGRDSVILQKPVKPKKGEVVLAWVEGCRYVVHRIVHIEGDRITLMGDGNLAGVEHCTLSDVKAVATHVVRGDGKKHYLYDKTLLAGAHVWRWLRPVRRYLLAIYNRI